MSQFEKMGNSPLNFSWKAFNQVHVFHRNLCFSYRKNICRETFVVYIILQNLNCYMFIDLKYSNHVKMQQNQVLFHK